MRRFMALPFAPFLSRRRVYAFPVRLFANTAVAFFASCHRIECVPQIAGYFAAKFIPVCKRYTADFGFTWMRGCDHVNRVAVARIAPETADDLNTVDMDAVNLNTVLATCVGEDQVWFCVFRHCPVSILYFYPLMLLLLIPLLLMLMLPLQSCSNTISAPFIARAGSRTPLNNPAAHCLSGFKVGSRSAPVLFSFRVGHTPCMMCQPSPSSRVTSALQVARN